MQQLTKKELLKLMYAYNNYVMEFFEDHDAESTPVSIFEFYDNEYQFIEE